MDQLEAALAALANAADLIVRQGGMAAIDMADHVGVGLQHHILVDEARARSFGGRRYPTTRSTLSRQRLF